MIIAGTDLLSSLTPYVHILSSSSNPTHCSQCLTISSDLKRCSKCHRISYCSVSCQRKDWIYHKYECAVLHQITDEYDLIRLYVRLLLRYQTDRGIDGNSSKRTIDDLQTHEDEIRRDRRRFQTFQSILKGVQQCNFLDAIDERNLFLLFCRLVINTLTIHDPIDLKPIGYGLYLDATVYNHSCTPTCHTVFNGIYLSIRTISDQTDDDWTINYIDLLESYEVRQRHLIENYYFHCQCSRCRNHQSSEIILLEKIRYHEEQMDRSINEQNLQQAYQSSQELCDNYEKLFPHYHAYVSLHHVKHLKLALFLADNIDQNLLQTLMKTTCERLQISMGDQHPLTQEAIRLCEQYRLEMALQQRQLM